MQSSSLLSLSPASYHKPKLALQYQSSNAGTHPLPRVLLPRLIHLSPSSMTYLSAASHQLVHSTSAKFVPKATSSSLPESADGRSVIQSLKLGAMFAIWYLFNIYFNILNKQLSAIVPLAIAHATGNLLTNISLGKVAVSFTHTIKALEPLFTVVLSAIFLGQSPSPWVVSSLVPIVGGVALASLTEVSFNWTGFCSVMVSNLVNQSRNVFSKKFMDRKEETLDDINLFSIMTIMAFLLLMPAAILIDGVKFTPSYFQYAIDSQGMTIRMLGTKLLLSALCLHYYQQVSYVILLMVSPVTHSVGNCLKRVVVIVSSVIFFQTPVSHVNSLGTTLALIGVFLYTRARKMKPKLKAL